MMAEDSEVKIWKVVIIAKLGTLQNSAKFSLNPEPPRFSLKVWDILTSGKKNVLIMLASIQAV